MPRDYTDFNCFHRPGNSYADQLGIYRYSCAYYYLGVDLARKPYTVQKAQEVEPMEMGFSLPITFFSASEIAPDWDTSDRDAYLRSFWKRFGNDMIQGVLAACVAKIQTQNWEIEGPEGLVEMYHPILRDDANFGKGYGNMVSRGVIDYYTQDNGWFMERQRSGPEDRSGPMLGIAHLDSARMRPTGNMDFPYTYNDVYGAHHLMHRSQFIRIVDMPDPRTELHGWDRGFCALSRALSTSIILMMLVTLKREKLSDLPPSALAIFNNLNRKQFEKAISLYGAQEDMKSNTIWRQLMPLFGIDPAHPATVQFLSLREVWESFDDMMAMNIAAYCFAAAFRVDPREFWPVSQGPLGTGKEAEVQHQKAKAKSTGLLFTEVERAFNARDSLPPGLTWKYVLQDADEEQQRSIIHQTQIANVKLMQEAGAGLVPDEVRWLLATQYKVLPQAMLKAPEEGETFDLTHADVYLDDVERQAKEYNGWWWGPMVRMDQNGCKSIVNQIGYKLPSGVMFLGLKGKVVDVIPQPVEMLDVGDNGNLIFGSKELLEVGLKEQFPCCESHAFQLFPDIVHDLFLLNYLTLPQMCKASMAPSQWVYSVSQAIPAITSGQDVLDVAGEEIARALDAVDFELGDKEGKALQTINQKIASLPAPIARTVRDNAKRLRTALGASTKRRLDALKSITDEEWVEAVAQDELADQPELV